MLGRPNRALPVLAYSLAGAWLICSVVTVLRKVRSSTTWAVCGNSSDTHAPLRPYRANLRVVARSLGVCFSMNDESMKAKRLPPVSDASGKRRGQLFPRDELIQVNQHPRHRRPRRGPRRVGVLGGVAGEPLRRLRVGLVLRHLLVQEPLEPVELRRRRLAAQAQA